MGKKRARQDPPRVGEQHDANAPAADPNGSAIAAAQELSQHIYASLLMSTKAGVEAHSITDSMPADQRLEAWRKNVHRLDPVFAQAHLNLTSKTLPPWGANWIASLSLSNMGRDGAAPGRRDRSAGIHANTVILLGMRQLELERHPMLKSDR